MAKAPAPAASWHQLAVPDARCRARWARGTDATGWAECGRQWDAVAIDSCTLGLDALVAMRVGTRSGYPVLADLLRDLLYVMVAPGTGACAAEVPGVRVLSAGRYLLMPTTGHGSISAHWISAPRTTPLRLVDVGQLTHHLIALTDAAHERAVQ
ncbi:hypothetical protein [Streptomyces sp. H39-C1]|uniref:hypothetical protein n=1 Tax=Streptomyces sp. H39-C1 TaxID=3004355 RepID=UPI0022B00283|nr:hypothetical protein [Streptomyces sp. H39-C1]MCZ4101088.1 hypothetical protein [Streptomyces sp. H39-C1]